MVRDASQGTLRHAAGLTPKDGLATLFVGAAVGLYALWAVSTARHAFGGAAPRSPSGAA